MSAGDQALEFLGRALECDDAIAQHEELGLLPLRGIGRHHLDLTAFVDGLPPSAFKASGHKSSISAQLDAAAKQEAYTLAEWGHRGGGGPHALKIARHINQTGDTDA